MTPTKIGGVFFFGEDRLEIFETVYQVGGGLALLVKDHEGMPYDIISVNIEGAVLEPDEFCVPTYKMRSQWVEKLLSLGLFEVVEGKEFPSGFIKAPVWRLLPENERTIHFGSLEMPPGHMQRNPDPFRKEYPTEVDGQWMEERYQNAKDLQGRGEQ